MKFSKMIPLELMAKLVLHSTMVLFFVNFVLGYLTKEGFPLIKLMVAFFLFGFCLLISGRAFNLKYTSIMLPFFRKFTNVFGVWKK